MKIAFQMDPIGPIDINADSTFRLAEEAQARGVPREPRSLAIDFELDGFTHA